MRLAEACGPRTAIAAKSLALPPRLWELGAWNPLRAMADGRKSCRKMSSSLGGLAYLSLGHDVSRLMRVWVWPVHEVLGERQESNDADTLLTRAPQGGPRDTSTKS